MAEVVRIRLPAGAAMAEVTCYQARHYVSSLPRLMRHWDADRKVWKVDVQLIGRLASDMRVAGFTVVIDQDQEETPETWADAMFTELPAGLANEAYRALLRVLHPDLTGGDHIPMAQLNAARDRARGLMH